MKIGILTHFHKSTNYGGVLQAYALCRYLNDRGHSASQILYKHKTTKISTAPISAEEFCVKIISKLEKNIYRRKNREIKKRMESLFYGFRELVPHTSREYTKENICDTADGYDVFITGSDQVWNPIWYDSAYMLDFVRDDTPKISYAASIGLEELDEEQKTIFRTHLSDFRAVSVREQTASDLISNLITQEAKLCVDPTLLLTADEWDTIVSERKINEKYVFMYFLGNDLKSRRLAEKFTQKKGLKLVMIPDLMGVYRKSDWRIRGDKVTDATPNDFISLIKNAEYVFTDSFHACVFSLLYRKEFFTFQRSGAVKMSSRIQNLTELFECPERFCIKKQTKTLKYILSCKVMDYSKINELFVNVKKDSIKYLDSCLY